jgi:hypothetical protein
LSRLIVLISHLFRLAGAFNFRKNYSPPLVHHLDPTGGVSGILCGRRSIRSSTGKRHGAAWDTERRGPHMKQCRCEAQASGRKPSPEIKNRRAGVTVTEHDFFLIHLFF